MPLMARVGASPAAVRRPVVIELVGLPGSGKTTIAACAIEELDAIGYRVAGRRALGNRGRFDTVRVALHHARHPRTVWAALRAAFATKPVSKTRIVHALRLADWAYRLTMRRARRYDIVVLDQAMVQEGWSISLESPCPALGLINAALFRVLRDPGLLIALVHVDVAPDDARQRLAARESHGSRFDAAGPEEVGRLLEAAAPRLHQIVQRAVADCDLVHLRIEATSPPAVTAREVAAFVRSLIEPPARSRHEIVPAVASALAAQIVETGAAR